MKQIINKILIGLVAALFLPTIVFAANVGFVPSTGLWFSRTELNPTETIRIYTVVINNDYPTLEGTVTFYDNNTAIDSVSVKISKDGAQQIRVFWQPTEGTHAVSAKFTKAVAVDEKGVKQVLDIGTISSVAGAPLKVNEGAVVSEPVYTQNSVTATTSPNVSAAAIIGSQTEIVVKKEGAKLVLTPSTFEPPVSSQAEGTSNQTSQASSAVTPGEQTSSVGGDIFAQNRAALDKAKDLAYTITTTANKVENAYNTTKSAVATGQKWYQKGRAAVEAARAFIEKMEPFFAAVEPVWRNLSNNNEPKRIAIIAGVVLVTYWVLRFYIRRQRRLRWEEENYR